MDSERKIEKWLRAFAKKRRADAGDSFTLHPATRRMLHGEIARRAPKRDESGRGFFLKIFRALRPAYLYLACFAIFIFMCAALVLPAMSKSKSRAVTMGAMSNLKQVGATAQLLAEENSNRLPQSLAEIQRVAGTNTTIDPVSGKPFVYIAGGRSLDDLQSNSVLAYSPDASKRRAVLFADGHVEAMSSEQFSQLTNRGLLQLASSQTFARKELAPATTPMPAAAISPEGKIPAGGKSTLATQNANVASGSLAQSDNLTVGTRAGELPADRLRITSGLPETEKSKSEDAARAEKKLDEPALVLNGAASTNAASKVTIIPGAIAQNEPEAAMNEASSRAPLPAAPPAGSYARQLAKDELFDKAASQNRVSAPGASQRFVQTGVAMNSQNQFKNIYANSKAAPLLANFEVQQVGDAISVVDADGSVYNGYLVVLGDQNAPATEQMKTLAPRQENYQNAATKNSNQAGQMYFFRVAGTNRSLRQNIVFSGNLLANSIATQAPQQKQMNQQNTLGGFGGGGGAGGANFQNQNAAKNQFQQTLTNSWQGILSNSRIAGTCVIGDTNRIEVNAVPIQ